MMPARLLEDFEVFTQAEEEQEQIRVFEKDAIADFEARKAGVLFGTSSEFNLDAVRRRAPVKDQPYVNRKGLGGDKYEAHMDAKSAHIARKAAFRTAAVDEITDPQRRLNGTMGVTPHALRIA